MRLLAYSTLRNGVTKLSRMKAIRVHEFGDPSVMKVEEIADLSAGPGQLLIGLKAAGVNPVDNTSATDITPLFRRCRTLPDPTLPEPLKR